LDQTVMFTGGCLLFLGGLMIGVAGNAKGAPIVGMAHTLGLLEAVFMLTFAVLRPHLQFNPLNTWIFLGLTFVSFYSNFAGVCMTVITGAGGGQYLPPWDTYVTNDPTTVNRLVGFLLNMSAAAVALPVMLAMGWFAKTRQAWITVVSLLFTAAMLYFTFST
ncbi:MAG: hypothetical protein P8R04_03225, partial [Gammaproteobacteria bacterium]|nr:hypothetical protein [Gammaproteobacteria bacterium]